MTRGFVPPVTFTVFKTEISSEIEAVLVTGLRFLVCTGEEETGSGSGFEMPFSARVRIIAKSLETDGGESGQIIVSFV